MEAEPVPKNEQEMKIIEVVLGRDALAENPKKTLEKDLETLRNHKEYLEQCIKVKQQNLEKVEERITEYEQAIGQMPAFSQEVNAFRFV